MPEKGTIVHIDDIDDVAEMESDGEWVIVGEGVMNALLSCEEYLIYVNCSSKIAATLGELDCEKCFAKMKTLSCNTNSIAQMMLPSETNGGTHPATVYHQVLRTIVKDVPRAIVSKKLLCTVLHHFTGKGDVVICAKPA